RPFVSGRGGTGGAAPGQRKPAAPSVGGRNDGGPLPNFEPIGDQSGSGAGSSAVAGQTSATGSIGGGRPPLPASSSGPAGDQATQTGPNRTGQKSDRTTNPGVNGGRGQAGGFDWERAAQDRPDSGGTGELVSDPGQGAQFAGDQAAFQGNTAA